MVRAILQRALMLLTAWSFWSAGETAPALREKIAHVERLTHTLLIVTSAGVAVFTYFGVMLPLAEAGGSSLFQKGQAVAFALSVGTLVFLGWSYLFSLAYELTGKRLATALLAGGLMIGTVAAVDAPFNVLALAGDAAVQLSLADTVHSYERKRDAVVERASQPKQLVAGLRVEATRFANLRSGEEKSGTFSGKKAAGKVSASFGQVADLLGGLANELDAGVKQTGTLAEQLNGALAQMKGFTFRAGPMRARTEGVAAGADKIDALLTQIAQSDPTASIDATLASLDSSLLRPQAGGSGFAQAQAAEVGAIAGMVKPVADELRKAAAKLHASAPVAGETMRPESPLTAIRTYRYALAPHWAAALFVDLAPLGLLIMLIAARREAKRAAASVSKTNSPTTGDGQ